MWAKLQCQDMNKGGQKCKQVLICVDKCDQCQNL